MTSRRDFLIPFIEDIKAVAVLKICRPVGHLILLGFIAHTVQQHPFDIAAILPSQLLSKLTPVYQGTASTGACVFRGVLSL